MKNENIPFSPTKQQQQSWTTTNIISFYNSAFYILVYKIGTANIGETNRIYRHIININAILLTSCLTLQVRTMIHQQHHFLQD